MVRKTRQTQRYIPKRIDFVESVDATSRWLIQKDCDEKHSTRKLHSARSWFYKWSYYKGDFKKLLALKWLYCDRPASPEFSTTATTINIAIDWLRRNSAQPRRRSISRAYAVVLSYVLIQFCCYWRSLLTHVFLMRFINRGVINRRWRLWPYVAKYTLLDE